MLINLWWRRKKSDLLLKHQYRLYWHGKHGVIHWSRVYENGIKLADQDGVNAEVVQFFSIFHDSRRRNESWDRGY